MVKGLKRNLEEMAEAKKELKTNISKLKGALLYKSTQMKDMNLHVELVEEQTRNLSVDNGSLHATRREILCFRGAVLVQSTR